MRRRDEPNTLPFYAESRRIANRSVKPTTLTPDVVRPYGGFHQTPGQNHSMVSRSGIHERARHYPVYISRSGRLECR